MTDKAAKLFREALALNESERDELIRLLTGCADGGYASPAIEAAWLAEVRRREQAIDEGREAWLSGDAVMRELRDKYRA